MNTLHQEIFDNLMALTAAEESFYFTDQVIDSIVYRIFDYRLASYQQWLHPHALECRGIMFRVDENGVAKALVSWPFEKFFNLHENPFTMDVDLSNPLSIQEKMDGSLISTFCHEGQIFLKSKGSLFSTQALAAQNLLDSKAYDSLYKALHHLVITLNQTVIMEYTAPDNRIVIPSDEPRLTVLGIRSNDTGEYMDPPAYLKGIEPYMVRDLVDEVSDVNAFVESIDDMTGIEGYVLRLANGQRVKIKTQWYVKLHHIKDSINSQRRLFEAVVYDTVDDVRAQFWDDQDAIARIDEMEQKVATIYNHLVDQVETFYNANNLLGRKEYAIKGQKELDRLCFSIAMRKYTGHNIDYRDTMVRHRMDFGIKDEPKSLSLQPES